MTTLKISFENTFKIMHFFIQCEYFLTVLKFIQFYEYSLLLSNICISIVTFDLIT